MNKNISAGFQLVVDSWENDGDSPKTITLYGLSKEKVLFFLEFLKGFDSDDERFCNQGVEDELLIQYVDKVLLRHPSVAREIVEEYDLGHTVEDIPDEQNFSHYVSDSYYQIVVDLLGSPENSYYQDEHNFCRVFESAEVYFVPNEIINVTRNFGYEKAN
jgi:hypothetical protein